MPPMPIQPPQLLPLPQFGDHRGNLVAAEIGRDLPFLPQRFLLIHEVPPSHVRGEHAHWRCGQILICLCGQITVWTDDGAAQREFVLDHVGTGLHIPPMVWASQHSHTPGAVLMVLASDPYDEADYIRNYADWEKAIGRSP